MTFGVPADDRLLDVTLTAGQTVIDTDFPVLADADLTIVRVRAGVETAFVLDTDYSLADVGELGYKRITLTVAAEASDRLVIRGTRSAERTSNILSGEMRASVFNAEYRSLIVLIQELVRDQALALRVDPIDDLTITRELPLKADRLGKFLRFNGVTGAPEVADATTDAPVFHIVTAVPGAGLGNDGDLAIWLNAADAEHGNVYSKAAGAWSFRGNIKGPQGTAGTGVPAGGALNQVLRKASASDYDVEWGAPSGGGGGGSNSLNDFRLTVADGDPLPTADQTGKTTLYCTPYTGNGISLYDGSDWAVLTSAQVTAAIPSTTDTNHDVFAYDNGGTLTLEFVAWTDATTRATAIVKQNGVWVKSGAATRRLLGTIRTTGTSGQCEDSRTSRFVANVDNARARSLFFAANTESAYNYNDGSVTPPQVMYKSLDSSNNFKAVFPTAETFASVSAHSMVFNASTQNAAAADIGIDGLTRDADISLGAFGSTANVLIATYEGQPGAGMHTFYHLEYLHANKDTTSFYDAFNGTLAGLRGIVWI
jgi:hypothetical protein